MKIQSIILLLFVSGAAFAQKNQLKVTIAHVKPNQGKVLIGLFDEHDKRVKGVFQSADNQTVSIVFEDLAAGKYAVKTFQDLNNNKKLDKNFVGYPNEPFGFSNNFRPKFGPPAITDLLVEVKGEKAIEITLN